MREFKARVWTSDIVQGVEVDIFFDFEMYFK